MTMTNFTTNEQAEQLLVSPTASLLFKHSCTCPVSTAAHDEIVDFLTTNPMPVGVVVVQEARPLSNWLATRLGFVHQSPQVFLVRDGKVVWQASHWGITKQKLAEAVSRL